MKENNTGIVPESIKNQILELKKIEINLGHIPPESWTINELQKKIEQSNINQTTVKLEKQSENMFAQICKELIKIKFTPTQIAQAINAELCYVGGPKYCNEIEVNEALEN